ncbi:MAG: CoA transferase [Betaproteobacteria bacterium]|nr:CoA transferase [Betaproteobacteria bacterium]
MTDDTLPRPLSGVRVLDLSRILAGPWCTQLLADMGAEVIKIERPGSGDDTRSWGPPYLRDAHGQETSEAAYYLACNRGKKSVCIDIAQPEGQQLVRELAAMSDVVVENYRVGQLAKYGLDYASLSAAHPGLIYCSITGFGQNGPYAARAGYDYVVQGMSGFMSITGEREGTPGTQPQKAGIAVSDIFTGLYAGLGILGALHQRDVSGEGQYIDLALLDVMVASLANMNLNFLTSGVAPVRAGNAHQNLVPYQVFDTRDSHVIVAVGNDGQFRKFCEVAGCPQLADDPRFATNPQRVRHRDVLIAQLADIMRGRDKADWIAQLEVAGVPCGPIDTLAEAFDNPQVRARGLRFDLPHPLAGQVPMVRSPLVFGTTGLHATTPPPTLGEHTDAVLRTLLGHSDDEIAALRQRGTVA